MIAASRYLFLTPVAESDIREGSTPVAYARADAWERAGHVQRPVAGTRALGATVLGTWRRMDTVYVEELNNRLTSQCTCRQPSLCAHGAAVLLHWLRHADQFANGTPRPPTAPAAAGPAPAPDGAPSGLTPESPDDLSSLLSIWTMNELREIARRRGVRPNNKGKADLIAQLAAALADPANVDAALAALGADELLTLQLIQLLGPHLATDEAVAVAFRWFGGRAAEPPVAALTQRVLIGRVADASVGLYGLAVLAAVAARLPPLPALARPAAGPEGAPAEPGLDLPQALVALAVEASRRSIAPRDADPAPTARGEAPAYWRSIGAGGQAATAERAGQARVTPIAPMLPRAERVRLAHAMGRPADFVTLALHIGLALGIFDTTDRLVANVEPLLRLLQSSPRLRREVYLATLEAPQYLAELRRLFGEGESVQMHIRTGYFGEASLLVGQAAQWRALLARALRGMPTGVWLDFRSFVEGLREWAPWQSSLLSFTSLRGGARPIWWIRTERDDAPLDLSVAENWEQVYGRFVSLAFVITFAGIGMIDLMMEGDQPRAFRVRPLPPLEGAGEPPPGGPLLRVDATLGVDAPPGMADLSPYATLLQGAALIAYSAQGLRFQLQAERVRMLFERGLDGDRLAQFLDGYSAEPMPAAARETLARWWSRFGRLRLYDAVTLLELADDFLLPELTRTTSLATAIVATLSPRLVVVEASAVNRLITEFTRAGHPPGVFDGR